MIKRTRRKFTDELESLLQLCKKQGSRFRQYKIDYPHIERKPQDNTDYDERNKKISTKTDLITEHLREYLKKFRLY